MSKKLKLFRQSGSPVDLKDRAAYDADWRAFFDKAEARADKVFQKTTGKLNKVPKMILLSRFLRFGERQLVRKYNKEVLTDLPKSAKAWTELISAYEDTPIMIARTQDGNEVVGVLMDLMGQNQ